MSEPTEITADVLKAMPLPFPSGDSDKEARGRVLVVGGSTQVPGALRLAGEAALRAGAGKLQMAAPASLCPTLALLTPEGRAFAMPEHDGEIAPDAADAIREVLTKCDAVLIGPGMIDKTPACALTERLLAAAPGPGFVIDAAAMAGCWARPEQVRRHGGRVILTPHAGEMAGLTGVSKDEVQANPMRAARDAAARLRAVVAVKGEHTFIASPDGRGWVHRSGAVGLATSGSGDVLAGVIAGLLGRGATAEQATLWGVFLHGRAGARLASKVGPLGFLARELPGEIPALMAAFA